MARTSTPVSKRKPRKPKSKPTHKRLQMTGIEPLAMSIDQFARAHGINRTTVYEMLRRGEGPECMRAGKRRLVSFEAAARWRAKRESAEAMEVAA